jgi:hypothetical protein
MDLGRERRVGLVEKMRNCRVRASFKTPCRRPIGITTAILDCTIPEMCIKCLQMGGIHSITSRIYMRGTWTGIEGGTLDLQVPVGNFLLPSLLQKRQHLAGSSTPEKAANLAINVLSVILLKTLRPLTWPGIQPITMGPEMRSTIQEKGEAVGQVQDPHQDPKGMTEGADGRALNWTRQRVVFH